MAVRGYVDGVIDGEVFGWAFDDERPGVRIRVSCTLDGTGLGTASAEQMRDDVRAAGLGDGLSGFRVPIAAPLAPGTHTVEVREEGTGELLRLADDWIAVGEDGVPIAGVVLRSNAVPPSSTSAPSSRELALVGAGTWLFALPAAGGEGPRGLARTSHSGLDADVEAVEAFHAAAAAAGAVGCAVEVPDKLQVYADHLPEGFAVDPDGRWARRLQARLRDSDAGGVLDLYDALLDARASLDECINIVVVLEQFCANTALGDDLQPV